MTQPTLFVDKLGDMSGDPLQMVVQRVAFGATIVPELVTSGSIEADIAIVGNASRALHFLKETEHTVVGVFITRKEDREAAKSLAGNYPDRVRVLEVLQFVVSLLALIGEKTKKEVPDADSARG